MQRLTINDIARLAGVSKKTVSRVINNSPLLGAATRAKVEAVIAETGYVPDPQARALALKRSMLLALVHDGAQPGLLAELESGLLEALDGSGFALIICKVSRNTPQAELARFAAQHKPAGAVLAPHLRGASELLETCSAQGIPAASLDAAAGDGPSQERLAMARMIAWLIRIGHRRIGLVAGPEHSPTARERELGYLDAMADHDLDRGPSLIVTGDNSFASGSVGATLLLEVSPRPSAIVACSDEMAAGALQAATRKGLQVPEDLSIAAFDDTALAAQLSPALTAMHVPWSRIGKAAAEQVLGIGSGGTIAPFIPDLALRDSVAEWNDQVAVLAPPPLYHSG